jgi:hypothetical protein
MGLPVTGARLETSAIVLVPVLALATMGLGLRAGASSRALGARVYAASPGRGRAGLSLQLLTLVEERGVPEVIPVPAITVLARARGREARWQGASNGEGVAEVWLDLEGLLADDSLDLSVVSGDGVTLASGALRVPRAETDVAEDAAIRAMRRSGDLLLDVYIYGGKLVPGSAGTVVGVRVRDAAGRADDAKLTADAEPGLSVDGPFTPAESGWSTVHVTAEFLTAAWTLTATSADSARTGTWSGALPVAAGAAAVDLPPSIAAETPYPFTLDVPVASPRLYVGVVDSRGTDFAAALDLAPADAGRATVVLPPLALGSYWLVTSSDARGAESMSGTTVARPFRAGESAGESRDRALAELSRNSPPTVSRTMALDGFAVLRRRAAWVRARAMTIALGALATAMGLETWLILRAAARARRRMLALSDAALQAGLDTLEGAGAAARARVRVAVLIVVTLLGFALLAMLLLDRGGN